MGSLGFRPKKMEDLDLEVLKQHTIDKFFKLKFINDAFNINYHYSWLVKHWKKLLKAVVHEKWEVCDYPFTPIDVSLSRSKFDNVSFVTNMFDKKLCSYYLDENGAAVSFPYEKSKGKEESNFTIIKDKEEGVSYVFTDKYLEKHEEADPDKAVAMIEQYCLDYKKNKFLFYITYMKKNISKEKLNNIAAKDMMKEISRQIQYQNLLALNNLLMIQNMNRLIRH